MQYFVQICLLSDRKETQNLKIKYLWFCHIFDYEVYLSFLGAAWKEIIGEIKYCAFKVYFL